MDDQPETATVETSSSVTKGPAKRPIMTDDVIRAVLVSALLAIVAIILLKGLAVPDWFIAIVSNAVGFYFGSRSRSER